MKEIIQLLISRIRIIPGVNDVRIYNNQLQHHKEEDVIFYPAVFVELMEAQYIPFNGGSEVQRGKAEVRVHIINENINQGADLSIYDLKSLVHQYLHRYNGDMFTAMVRTTETLDSDHDNLYDYQITYTFDFVEETQPLPSNVNADFFFDYNLTGTL